MLRRSVWTTVVFLTATALATAHVTRTRPINIQSRLASFPATLGPWTGHDDQFEPHVYSTLKMDDDLLRCYRAADGSFHWLFVAYYGTEKGGRTGHMPAYCYPGAGYVIERNETMELTTAQGPIRVNHLLTRKGDIRTSVLYWMQSHEKICTNGWDLNWLRFQRRVRENRNDGAFVRISSPLGSSLEDTVAEQKQFAVQVLETLPGHWPVETELKN